MIRPVCILVAAMGGEGGGVLADWLIDAATRADFPVQSTSVPGVAQRTGATTYYVEIFPRSRSALGGREPVLSLTPVPGQLDVVAASELVEAGRAIQSGYVDPQRTTLVASTHREYAISEKAAMSDGRYDSSRIVDAAGQRSQRAVLFDMRALAQKNGTVINTVLFGALAGAGVLPFDRAACEEAIRRLGKAVETSLRGFAAGFDAASGRVAAADRLDATVRASAPLPPRAARLPVALHDVLAAGVALTNEFQDAAYAEVYLDRVERLAAAEAARGSSSFEATREAARYLALWMAYEDVIRVAQLKTRRDRLARVRREVGARDGEPMRVTEYLKPGLDEIASLLPPAAAAWLRRSSEGRTWHRGLHVRTDTVRGFLMLCMLRSLRPWRRRTSRYVEEQATIERWLGAVETALPGPKALELALCGNLVKGYGDTSRRGHRNLDAILQQAAAGADAAQLRAARQAALADPEGRQLSTALGRPLVQPIRIVRRRPAA
jgi:indolepyruvate ferredoxin oxidoreductase beta subunit